MTRQQISTRNRPQRMARSVVDAVAGRTERLRSKGTLLAQVVLRPKSADWCACKRPATDAELDLESSQEWCWICRRPVEPPSRLDRVIAAFLA